MAVSSGCVSVFFAAVIIRAKIQGAHTVHSHRDSVISMNDIAFSSTSTDDNSETSDDCTGGSNCNQAFQMENDTGGDFLPSEKNSTNNSTKKKEDDDEEMPMN